MTESDLEEIDNNFVPVRIQLLINLINLSMIYGWDENMRKNFFIFSPTTEKRVYTKKKTRPLYSKSIQTLWICHSTSFVVVGSGTSFLKNEVVYDTFVTKRSGKKNSAMLLNLIVSKSKLVRCIIIHLSYGDVWGFSDFFLEYLGKQSIKDVPKFTYACAANVT